MPPTMPPIAPPERPDEGGGAAMVWDVLAEAEAEAEAGVLVAAEAPGVVEVCASRDCWLRVKDAAEGLARLSDAKVSLRRVLLSRRTGLGLVL
jgi:hypothetical protein